jgi:hypothetical protein
LHRIRRAVSVGLTGDLFKEATLKRFVLYLAAVSATTAALALPAGAAPPQPPPGCEVVVNTPAAVTGAPQAQANKEATFVRLCDGAG